MNAIVYGEWKVQRDDRMFDARHPAPDLDMLANRTVVERQIPGEPDRSMDLTEPSESFRSTSVNTHPDIPDYCSTFVPNSNPAGPIVGHVQSHAVEVPLRSASGPAIATSRIETPTSNFRLFTIRDC